MSSNTQSRRHKILELIHAQGFCSVVALAESLGVSEVTIRTDLKALEQDNKVSRVHGGAVLTSQPRSQNFLARAQINEDKKRWIARHAAELVEDFDSIILDASTTAYHMAEYLAPRQGLTVFTNGVEVAYRLAQNATNKVILIGGLLRLHTDSVGGPFAENVLETVKVRKAFLSGTGWSSALELMDDELFEVQVKQAMVARAEAVIVLVDSTKFNKQGLASFAPSQRIDWIITDDQIDESVLTALRQAGARVMVCSKYAARNITPDDARKPIRIGFANLNTKIAFSTAVQQGLVRAAARHNVDLLLTDNREEGVTALANVEYFIQEGVDLAVEFNLDARYSNVLMERLRAAEIPVIAIDIPLPGATFVGVDNYRAGLMAGNLLGQYASQRWGGTVDKVLSLDLPLSGAVPAARMQGQLDALRELVTLADDDIIHLDSKNSYEQSRQVVMEVLPALKGAERIVVLCFNDETALGAQTAFEEAGSAHRMITVTLGADPMGLKELQRAGTRFIGAVAFFPERYGETVIETALQILGGKPVPPAICTQHVLILPDETIQTLNLDTLPYEWLTSAAYAAAQTTPQPGESAIERIVPTGIPTI
ncbi:MAG: substrate-binding domain-containing protein [Anaerolineae bacterium]|nr:substrate-binding domain-containing protein [Anaerolineae bacterium]